MSRSEPSLAAEERLRWLSEQLEQSGTIGILDAATTLGVSEMTIRRDLTELEERGSARRIRGGARAVGPQAFSERRETMVRAKAKIASKLADLVPATGAIAFDASSTVMRLATGLRRARDLVVLTNGPDTFAALQGQSGVTPLLTGGRLDSRTGSLVGPLASWSAGQLVVECLVASAAAIDPDVGSLEATLEEAEVKRSLAAAGARVVLAVDSSKLGQSAAAVGLEWERIDVLVTELDRRDRRLAPYRELTDVR